MFPYTSDLRPSAPFDGQKTEEKYKTEDRDKEKKSSKEGSNPRSLNERLDRQSLCFINLPSILSD